MRMSHMTWTLGRVRPPDQTIAERAERDADQAAHKAPRKQVAVSGRCLCGASRSGSSVSITVIPAGRGTFRLASADDT